MGFLYIDLWQATVKSKSGDKVLPGPGAERLFPDDVLREAASSVLPPRGSQRLKARRWRLNPALVWRSRALHPHARLEIRQGTTPSRDSEVLGGGPGEKRRGYLASALREKVCGSAVVTGHATMFAAKSWARREEFKRRGKALLLVSHALATAQKWCREVFWLDQGTFRLIGKPAEVVESYQKASNNKQECISNQHGYLKLGQGARTRCFTFSSPSR